MVRNTKIDNPTEYLPNRPYEGRGIITASCKKFMFQTLISVNILRDKGCMLPIELYYADDEEMSQADITALELTLDVKSINVTSFEEFKDYNARNFSIKPIALYLSSFDETIWIDADVIPLIDLESLFDLAHYKNHHHLFFNDIFSYGKNENAMTKKTISLFETYGRNIPSGTPETDSGLYMIHKTKFNPEFFSITALLNMDKDIYNHVYGDKELYRLGMALTDNYYTTIDINPCIIGKFFQSENLFCGNAVILMVDYQKPVAVHMTLHSVDHVNKYNNMWKESFWTHYITKQVDVDLRIVEPLNQEIVLKYEYDSKFMSPVTQEIKKVQESMFEYVKQFRNNYL